MADDRKRYADAIREMMGRTYSGTARTAEGLTHWSVKVNSQGEFEVETECNGKKKHETISRKNRKRWLALMKSLKKQRPGSIDWKEAEE